MTHTTETVDWKRPVDLPRDPDGLATVPEALARLRESLPTFIREMAAEMGSDHVVIALDGSPASAVAATVAVEALGSDGVTGLILPVYMNQEATARDAEAVAMALDIEYTRIQLQPILAAFQETIGVVGEPTDELVAMRNATARFQMSCSYYVADTMNALVVGAASRTDLLLGDMVKHADTGVDCLPLGDLYRTEVRALASDFGIPKEILEGPSRNSPRTDRFDVGELSLSSREVDQVIQLYVEEARGKRTIAEQTGVEPDVIERIVNWHSNTGHVRHHPPTPSIRDQFADFIEETS